VVAAVVVLLAGLAGAGIVFVRHQAGPAKGHGPTAQAPQTPQAPATPTTAGGTAPATPTTEAGAPPSGSAIVTAGFSFERPAGWHDASGAAKTPGAVELDSGERIDCALIGPLERDAGTLILVSSIAGPKLSDATRTDAEALGTVAVATLKDNPEVVEVSSPAVVDLDGVPAAKVGFRSVIHGDKVAGTELVTLHGGRLWRVLLVGTLADAGANRADLSTVVGGWRWRQP
jgi:hypothetical protein